MNDAGVTAVGAWVTEAGLKGAPETELLQGFCDRLAAAGFPLGRATVVIDTLHPVYEGRVFRWRSDQEEMIPGHAYGRTNTGDNTAESWQRSPFYRLIESGEAVLRRRVDAAARAEFPVLDDLHAGGQTDYLALLHRFSSDQVIGEMDCVYSSWSTPRVSGFGDGDIAVLQRLVPSLALAIKCAGLKQIAETLVETYLGRDAGRRVLTGRRIARGVVDKISAVLWYSDLRGFTRITDTTPPEQIIPLLNDYAEAIIPSIHDSGGEVLKLIGDGILAIFRAEHPDEACHRALTAERLARERTAPLNERRRAEGLPLTEPYLGLHIGEVFYGNIGSLDRLDFTVVGPAVNEVSRIAAMCRSAERDILMSSAFAAASGAADRAQIISVGRYALRGVGRPQELFTLLREA
jgi:adenylate cyclase